MRVHLVNPSHVSFGVAVITPRWLYVLAAATPTGWGDPILCDETLEPFDPEQLAPGDVVGIGIHTGNALRGYEVGHEVRARGAYVGLELAGVNAMQVAHGGGQHDDVAGRLAVAQNQLPHRGISVHHTHPDGPSAVA